MSEWNLPNVYVKAAIIVMEHADTYADLLTWWKMEEINRRRWELSPDKMPGSKLKEAFDARRSKLKHELETEGT